jgi:integrase
MPQWEYRKGRFRYEFMYLGKKYGSAGGKEGFKTKKEARAAEAVRRLEVEQMLSPSPGSMGFLEAATEYLAISKRNDAVKTYKYKAYVFDCFLTHAGNVPLKNITYTIVESYLLKRHSNANFNRHRKDLSVLFNWARKRGLLQINPCLLIDKLKEDKQRRPVPSHEEMERIMLAAGDARPFLLMLYHTQARLGEVLRLRWEDVLFEHRVVVLRTRKRTGGEQSDPYPMNQTLYDTLWRLWEKRKSEEWVFPNLATGDRYRQRPKLMRGICKRAGVPYYGFHSIRHYVANLMADSLKVSTKRISRLLRHTNIRTTEIYLGQEMDDLRETVELLDKKQFLEKSSHESPHENNRKS